MKLEKPDSGCYQLIIKLIADRRIRVGALGIITFKEGFYIYTGRAARGLNSRVQRHLRKVKKKRWHIDYLLEKSDIIKVIYFRGRLDECIINAEQFRKLKNARLVKKFGSSDCRCDGHLIWMEKIPGYD